MNKLIGYGILAVMATCIITVMFYDIGVAKGLAVLGIVAAIVGLFFLAFHLIDACEQSK